MAKRMELMPVGEVNQMTYKKFIAAFGGVVENSPMFAATVWSCRPFRDVHHIHQSICEVLDKLPDNAKQGVLRLIPELAGQTAEKISLASQNERKVVGIDIMTPEEREIMQERNRYYREKFGFPFVICARQNKVETIMQGIKIRFPNSAEDEMPTAIGEVKKICLLRLKDIVES